MLSLEDQNALQKKLKILKIIFGGIATAPMTIAVVAYFMAEMGSGTGILQDEDPLFSLIIRVVLISIGGLSPILVVLFNKYLFDENKMISKLSGIENLKKTAQDSINNPLADPELKHVLQEWLKNPQQQELLMKIRRELLLNAIIPAKITIFTLGEIPSIMGFMLYVMEANLTVFVLFICLSYIMFYRTYFSEEKLKELLQKLEMQPITP